MLRRILSNINDNFAQSLAGSAIIAISLFLWLDRTYFFWPPELTSTMNDQRVDIIIFILGVGLLISALFDNPNRVRNYVVFDQRCSYFCASTNPTMSWIFGRSKKNGLHRYWRFNNFYSNFKGSIQELGGRSLARSY